MQISTTRWSNFSFCETVFILQQLKTSCSLPQQRKLKFCLMLAIWHRHWCELWICKQGSSIETPVSLNQNNAHKCHIKTFSRSGASFRLRAKVILIIAAAELARNCSRLRLYFVVEDLLAPALLIETWSVSHFTFIDQKYLRGTSIIANSWNKL